MGIFLKRITTGIKTNRSDKNKKYYRKFLASDSIANSKHNKTS
jgi:hypothetical protein